MPQQNVSGFTSSTQLSGGHTGLITSTGASSNLTITGSGLANNLPVTINYPAGSSTPTYQWKALRTTNVNPGGTQCSAQVIQQNIQKGSPKGDTPDSVSITVGDSTPVNVNTWLGVVVVGKEDGGYGSGAKS
jgi:hypothetical protein